MKDINLDVAEWRQRDDFYNVLLPALGAPSWHGHNLDALNDSIAGDLNAVKPPFEIRIINTVAIPSGLRDYLSRFADLIDDLRSRENQKVYLILE